MPQEGAGAQEVRAAVDVGVMVGLREEAVNPGQLLQVLGQVGLDEGAIIPGQPSRPGHEFPGTAGGEAGGECVLEAPPVPTVPCPAELLTRPQAGGGVFEQGLGRVAVHHGLADDRADAAGFRLAEDRVRGVGMDGGVQDRRGGAQGQGVLQVAPGGGACVCQVREPGLGGENVALQPGQEFQTVGGHRLVLGQMGMQVHQAGQDPEGAQVLHGQSRMAGSHGPEGPRIADEPSLHDQPPIGLEMKLLEGRCGKEGRANQHEECQSLSLDRRRRELPSAPVQAVDQFLGRVESTPFT